MKKTVITALLIFAFLLFANQPMAEMYKWVDKNGVIHFSDTPPKGEKNVEVTETSNYAPPTPDKSSGSTQGPAKNKSKTVSEKQSKRKGTGQRNNKVEIYTTSWCRTSKQAIAYLRSNRITFKQYDIERDLVAMAKMRALGGRGVPFAIVNGTKLSGFSKNRYKKALGLP